MVWDAEGAEALSAERMLAEALEANRQLSELADGLIEDNALLREQVARLAERDAERDAELERLRADFAVLQRMLFGRSSEKSRPGPPAGGDDNAAGGGGQDRERRGAAGKKRGPGARAGRRDYSRLPRLEVFWDFPDGGYCCPECGEPFTPLTGSTSSGRWRLAALVTAAWIIVAPRALCRSRFQGSGAKLLCRSIATRVRVKAESHAPA